MKFSTVNPAARYLSEKNKSLETASALACRVSVIQEEDTLGCLSWELIGQFGADIV